MRSSKRENVVVFPLSRSGRTALSQKLLKFLDGKIVAIPAVNANTINLEEAAERIRGRSFAKTELSGAGANFI